MAIRTQIWNDLVNTRFQTFLLGFLLQKFQKLDRNINIFLAIASSTSIAVWAVWKQAPYLWAAIIAMSQVITVIKPYFPYSKYVKEFNSKCLKLDNINLEFERLWNKTQRGNVDEDNAEALLYDLKKQLIGVLNFNDEIFFDVSQNLKNKANLRMKTFLKTNYLIDINLNQ